MPCARRGFGTRGSPLERRLPAGYFETLSWPHVGPNADSRVVASGLPYSQAEGNGHPVYNAVQSLSPVQFCDPMDCRTPGSLSITISRSLLTLMSIESVMPSNRLILCRPLLLPWLVDGISCYEQVIFVCALLVHRMVTTPASYQRSMWSLDPGQSGKVYVTSSGQGALTRIMCLFQVQSLKSWCVSLWMHHPLPW